MILRNTYLRKIKRYENSARNLINNERIIEGSNPYNLGIIMDLLIEL